MAVALRETQQLLRHLRAIWLGRARLLPPAVSGYASWSVPSLMGHLVDLATDAVLVGEIDERARSLWTEFYGLGAPPRAQRDLALENGIGPDWASRLVRRVDKAVAHRIEPWPALPARLRLPSLRSVANPLQLDEGLIGARLAAEARGDVASVLAIDEVAAAVHGRPTRRRPSTDRQSRAAISTRHRRRDIARSEVAVHLAASATSSPVPAPVRRRAVTALTALPEDLAELVEDQLLRRRLPDLDFLRDLERQTRETYWEQRESVDPRILDIIETGFARFEVSPDPTTEAEALGTRARLLRDAEDLTVVAVARRIEALVGEAHSLTLMAHGDAALALRAHGFLSLATDTSERALRVIRDQRPPGQLGLAASHLSTYAATVRHTVGKAGAEARIERAYQFVNALRDAAEVAVDVGTANWVTVAHRRLIQLDIALAEARRERVRSRRLELSRASTQWIDQARRAARDTEVVSWKFSWELQEMRLALELQEREMFAESTERAVSLLDRESWFTNLLADLRALVTRAERRRWLDDSAIERLSDYLQPVDRNAYRLPTV